MIIKICDLLKDSCFTSLDLDYASFCITDLIKIIDSIKQSSITSIKFTGSYPTDDSVRLVCNLLESRRFEKLRLHFMSFDDEDIEEILSSIVKFSVSADFIFACCELCKIELMLRS